MDPVPGQIRLAVAGAALVAVTLPLAASGPPRRVLARQASVPVVVSASPAASTSSWDEWLTGLRSEALSRGVSQKVVNEALGELERLPVVVERDRTQAELTLTVDQYLKRRLTPRVVRDARDAAVRQRALLRKVTAAYGVPGSVLVAIWDLESNLGRFSGLRPTIPALATLSFDTRRAAMFREEIFAALQILDRGDVALDTLKGSWAGAMGQPQFMPSSYLKYAVDFDGDGRRDIWTSTADVLASIGNYLKQQGWAANVRWGREVRLPEAVATRIAGAVPLRMTGSCTALRDMTEPRPVAAWAALGIRLPNGSPLPSSELAASLVRTGGRAYLVYANYEALLSYNCAHTYALSVALLADRVGGN
jgi:membrane-bound lytic murein transglycosylase B